MVGGFSHTYMAALLLRTLKVGSVLPNNPFCLCAPERDMLPGPFSSYKKEDIRSQVHEGDHASIAKIVAKIAENQETMQLVQVIHQLIS